MIAAIRGRLASEIAWGPLGRALVFVALLLVFSLSGNQRLWMQASLVGLCTLLTHERLGLAASGMMLHGAAIVAGYILLSFALPAPPLFVVLCAVMAAGAIAMEAAGRKLRTLGFFTFIPSLYLACEVRAHCGTGAEMSACILGIAPFMAVSLILAAVIAETSHAWRSRKSGGRVSFRRLAHGSDFGMASFDGAAFGAVLVAVAGMAAFTEWYGLPDRQWAIWSAVSVIAAEAGKAHVKLGNRLFGAVLGVPAGIVLGQYMPHDMLVYDFAVLGATMTLIALKRYIVAVTFRYGLAALAMTVAGQSALMAEQRIVNVLLGGVAGFICIQAARLLVRRMGERAG